MSSPTIRYSLIDSLRGLAVLQMVLFHFLYDVFIIYGQMPDWYSRPLTFFWQQSICWSFILISGFTWQFGKKKALQRGLWLNFWGLVISAVTYFAVPEEAVWFGVLNFIGCAVWLMLPLEWLLHRAGCLLKKAYSRIGKHGIFRSSDKTALFLPLLGAAGSFLLFQVFYYLPYGWIGLGSFRLFLPESLYQSRLLVPLGLPYAGFLSSDYFPVLPWFFLYVTGHFLSSFARSCRPLQQLLSIRIPVLAGIGKKSLWIYLLHQPIAMGLCALLFTVF